MPPPSLSTNVVPDNSFTLGSRMDTNLSMLSDMSFSDVPSGFWDIRFQGSCPVCHHWHYKMKLKLSRHPGVYNGIRCENCGHKWFGLGGNSTHASLSAVGTVYDQGNQPALSPPLAVALESISENQLEPDNNSAYQKPVADADWRNSGRETDDLERLKDLRHKKTLTAQQNSCSCAPNCTCKRPSSSMAPNASVIDERPSLYPLDLAVSSSHDLNNNCSQRHSLDLVGIGSAFPADSIAGEPRLSVLTFSSSGSAPSHSRVGSYGRNALRQDNNAFVPSTSMTAHEQHFPAMASSSYAPSTDGDGSPRRNSFLPGRDSLHLRPRTESSSVPRVPSPLASPMYPPSEGEGELDRRRSDYTVSSLDTAELRRLSDRGGADGGMSISPIQESVSRVSSLEGYRGDEGMRVSPSPLLERESGEVGTGRREMGPLDSHPVV
ncbi:uncharacterized protein K452DRAFT_297140 [Aplosporella prunicola CBS 121167]|uniref:Uncharacterized protein n=1 Tax=Aplosporella prunicola CBS 121167 TaxID=1176127 RepID=A0A6A6BGX6_9PEZI|nr:uncharacterized protein K452DRAFT_297140 [Aplosporella prunicola CBS 121167]KAF2143399.1 hypothetical protein K452DRAFT_297140 [Aplosporella prunicola CBS 121167]